MNTSCSICLESFSSESDISTTPCGHVFHTECISNWVKNEQKDCPQCRKGCRWWELIKLYFSDLFKELDETKARELVANEKCLKLEKEKLKLSNQLDELKRQNQCCTEIFKLMIQNMAGDKNPKDHVGWTPLHTAANYGNVLIAGMILDVIDDKNPKNQDGWTPLHCAAKKGHFEIVEKILNAVEEKNPKDRNGWTPLHTAAQKGHEKIIEIILIATEDKNPENKDGWTPLHCAAQKGHLTSVKMILNVVKDKNPKNQSGVTPLFFAEKHGYFQIRNKILEHYNFFKRMKYGLFGTI